MDANGKVVNHARAFRYDSTSNQWKTLRDLPSGNRGLTAVAYGDRSILLFGGYTDSGFTSEVLLYDIQSDTYKRLKPMPLGLAGHRVCLERPRHLWRRRRGSDAEPVRTVPGRQTDGDRAVKQAILYGAGDLRIEERALDPEHLQPDQVYVETEVTALSTGTDLGNYLGNSTDIPGAPDYPRAVGYSNVGVVRAVGADAGSLQVGQRVFSLKPHQSAYIAHRSELLVPVPDGVSSEQASLAYLAQLGMAAMRHARYESGESVAVVGLGVIGLGTVAIARAMGATVTAVANSPLRAKSASEVGAHHVYVDRRRRAAFGYRCGCAHRESMVRVSSVGGDGARRGPDQHSRIPGTRRTAPRLQSARPNVVLWKATDAHRRRLLSARRVPACRTPIQSATQPRVSFLSDGSGAVCLEPIITHRIPAEHMRDAYELAKQHSKSLIAAVFDWRTA